MKRNWAAGGMEGLLENADPESLLVKGSLRLRRDGEGASFKTGLEEIFLYLEGRERCE